MSSYTPLQIANTFLKKFGKESGDISHMKLQKLVFYTYGWWLAENDEPLTAEGPEVWKYGPVFNTLYSSLAYLGMQPLDAPVRETPIGKAPIVPDEDDAVQNLIDGVWERYGGYSAGKLSDMTHAKGTPWQEEAAARNYKVPRHLQIGVDRIRTYFRNPLNHMDATAL